MIEFKNVSKSYNRNDYAVKKMNLTIERGELVTLIGPSGCGKTTSLKMINRLIQPTDGDILIDNKNIKEYDIHELRWNIGYVLQQIALFPHMTIEQNINIVPDLKKWDFSRKSDRTRELMDMIGLNPDEYLKRYPDELSGGQQQRVGVIRALAADPDIILMDEPFSALDPISRKQLQEDVRRLQQEIKKTIVFVTHDIKEAVTLGDRICLMRNGIVEQCDTPEKMMALPTNDFVANFINDANSIWNRKIGDLADNSVARPYIVYMEDMVDSHDQDFRIVINTEEKYEYLIYKGKKVDFRPICVNTSIEESVGRIQEIELPLYPVVRQGVLVGAINERNILDYLKNQGEAGALQ
ncbi:ATP-binding cassette domain-containing protein [Aciduricibacillus chroicocephali]|uniref:ATP-binding cassette domain-containing protein n=1 Tax=Aciduricibacillus chroicocephali TaxID=3054939 RepID=A0ABY9KYE3_9BACI|nr:ATP-binding cassette domain-containing protein [Bacillaceae bacterium 44XB]